MQGFQQGVQAAFVQFVITSLNPFLARLAVAINDFSDFAEVLFGVESVEDLNGLGE